MLCLKLQPPWPQLILDGIKTVENRTWPLKEKNGWIVACSSKPPAKKAAIADAKRRIAASGGDPDAVDFNAMRGGMVLGLFYVEECVKSQTPLNAWHNAGDYAWRITHVVKLPRPFALDPSDKFQTSVRLSNRPEYEREIKKQLKELWNSGYGSGGSGGALRAHRAPAAHRH